MIEEDGLCGMTSNPSIFEKAIAESDIYDKDIHDLAKELDDIIDMLYTIVNRMKVYKVEGANKNLIEFSSVIGESVRAVSRAVKGLRDKPACPME